MTYTLVSDGGSDRVLLPILSWSLRQQNEASITSQWADLGRIPRQADLAAKIRAALDLYPCELLFVHRDAEAQPPEERRNEIARALDAQQVVHVPIVPIRMTEAWLLANESAIRLAAGNPKGLENLNLPEVRNLEGIPDPKTLVHDALRTASGLNRTRRMKSPVHQRVHRIPEYIDDFSPLNQLSSFRTFQQDIREALHSIRHRG